MANDAIHRSAASGVHDRKPYPPCPMIGRVCRPKLMRLCMRFSLRTALIMMTCACFAAIWIGASQRLDDYRRAIQVEFGAGGSRISSSRIDAGLWAYLPKTFRPWQSYVHLEGIDVSNEDWIRIDRMNCRIVGLQLHGVKFDDSDLLAIAALPSFLSLEDVGFYKTNVTDEGVLEFQRSLPNCIVHSHKLRLAALNSSR